MNSSVQPHTMNPSELDVDAKEYHDRDRTPEPPAKDFHSDDETTTRVDSEIVDATKFAPNRIYYIQGHHLFSKEILAVDIKSLVPIVYEGSDISDEFRNAAKTVGEAKDAKPAFNIQKKHWYSKSFTVYDGADQSSELASWKHPTWSTGKAILSFPIDSKSSSHTLTLAPTKWTRRSNEWTQDSVPYTWKCDDKWKANRMTLYKVLGGTSTTIARYSQRWGSWNTGGVLLVDGREIDDLVAVLTACTMLRRMQQRAAERSQPRGGPVGGS